jgi:Flp pilus assembly protein CpaB
MRAKAIFRLAGLAGALALLLAGCKADARSADSEQAAPAEPPRTILVYSHNLPVCPYDELGDVTSNDEGGPDVRLAALRSQARDLEGDALIDLKGSQEEGDVRQGTLSATVVHFTDPTCTEAQ